MVGIQRLGGQGNPNRSCARSSTRTEAKQGKGRRRAARFLLAQTRQRRSCVLLEPLGSAPDKRTPNETNGDVRLIAAFVLLHVADGWSLAASAPSHSHALTLNCPPSVSGSPRDNPHSYPPAQLSCRTASSRSAVSTFRLVTLFARLNATNGGRTP